MCPEIEKLNTMQQVIENEKKEEKKHTHKMNE